MSKLSLPDWSETFVQAVVTDVTRLIGNQLWPVDSSAFKGWFGQFSSQEERFFAAALLHRLTLRTKRQFSASLQALYRGPLSHVVYPADDDLQLTRALCGNDDPKIRLVPVLRESDSPTKSGVVVLRRLQRLLRLNPKWIVWPWKASAMLKEGSIDRVIFVDDFLGSGDQFRDFFKEWKFPDMLGPDNMIYSPVVAHAKGVENLRTRFPQLIVTVIETLGEDAHFFDDASWSHLSRGQISGADALAWYEKFAKTRRLSPKNAGTLGVGNLALTFGFEHSTPNNALPILWYSGSNWCALLDR
jgi:hypothetical protein